MKVWGQRSWESWATLSCSQQHFIIYIISEKLCGINKSSLTYLYYFFLKLFEHGLFHLPSPVLGFKQPIGESQQFGEFCAQGHKQTGISAVPESV